MKLTAKATRVGKWWAIEVPEIEGLFTQAKRLDQIDAMVKDAAAGLTERPEQDFEVSVVVTNQNIQDTATAVREAVTASQVAAQRAASESANATKKLLSHGLAVRDVATLMHISPARVSQLRKIS